MTLGIRSQRRRGFLLLWANQPVVQHISHRRQLLQSRGKESPTQAAPENQPTMSLRGLKAWFGRGAAEDEDETMVRDPNV